ncbi:hypothetical protein GTP46_05970 [Duganella sp. FT135W]|uniref:Uncharacterized protein n=1 Tax=Duganella flavida TaxID=2692175 RepID=A0A6L8K400_9BURK|nr:hypothetical protein [Duganella flavida]MYM22186.1 hypothetical protein [Duganella flavida]
MFKVPFARASEQYGIFRLALQNIASASTFSRQNLAQRLEALLEEIALTDEFGIDAFGVGKHTARTTLMC